MNRRSFIGKIVQGGTVLATGLPEKLLSSEANTVDKLPLEISPFEIRMCDSFTHYFCGCPLDVMRNLQDLRLVVYDEENYVYVGKPVPSKEESMLRTTTTFPLSKNLDDPFVHKKYFLAALLIMDTETKKI